MVDTNRRRFLQVAGTGAGLGLAGCAGLDGNGAEEAGSNGTGSNESVADGATGEQGTDEGATSVPDVAVVVRIDQAALQQRQRELQQQLQEGEINRTTFQQELRTYQQDLVQDGFDAFDEEVEAELDVGERVPRQGAIRVSGPPETVLATLAYDSVSVLIEADELQQSTP